jgi:hypothetical protein
VVARSTTPDNRKYVGLFQSGFVIVMSIPDVIVMSIPDVIVMSIPDVIVMSIPDVIVMSIPDIILLSSTKQTNQVITILE